MSSNAETALVNARLLGSRNVKEQKQRPAHGHCHLKNTTRILILIIVTWMNQTVKTQMVPRNKYVIASLSTIDIFLVRK